MDRTAIRTSRAAMQVLLLSASMVGGLMAQRSSPAITAELQVAATGIAGKHHTLWLRTGPGKAPVKVSPTLRTFSLPISYKGPARADFFETAQDAQADPPTVQPLASVPLQAGALLLVFVPDAESKTRAYRVHATRAGSFPHGSFNFINFSKSAIFVQSEGKAKDVRIDPDRNHVFKFGGAEQSVGIRVAAVAPGADHRLIRQTNFSTNPDWREMVLFFDQPGTNRVRMSHLVDVRVDDP
ncbi:MAG: hypothetical protein HKN82_06305 [Akkermansiaceae bacterium]|nr:hypothetical protein [Akkermansiaceae bacterium]